MSVDDEKISKMIIATLEESIKINQQAYAEEQDKVRKRFIGDLVFALVVSLAEEKGMFLGRA